jgi:hypothetical protein
MSAMDINKSFAKFNPTIPTRWLLALAGVMWTGVGLMLLSYAFKWLTNPLSMITALLGLLGIIISFFSNRFQFSKLALKNIERILSYNEKACLFAFQAWKGYLIIGVMVTGGILLRSSALPKPYLAVVYAGIGGALLLASLNYYVRFFQIARAVRLQVKHD